MAVSGCGFFCGGEGIFLLAAEIPLEKHLFASRNRKPAFPENAREGKARQLEAVNVS